MITSFAEPSVVFLALFVVAQTADSRADDSCERVRGVDIFFGGRSAV